MNFEPDRSLHPCSSPSPMVTPFGPPWLYPQSTASSMAEEFDEVEWDGWSTFSFRFYVCICIPRNHLPSMTSNKSRSDVRLGLTAATAAGNPITSRIAQWRWRGQIMHVFSCFLASCDALSSPLASSIAIYLISISYAT